MKISREIKTAILAILGIALFIFGFSYLKGNNILENSRTFYVEYDNVGGLASSAPVNINGLKVGKVQSITFKGDGSAKLLVTFVVDSDFQFSKNSTAQLYDADLIGTKAITIVPAFDNAERAVTSNYLKGTIKAGLTDLVQQKLTPLQEKIESAMVSADSLLLNMNSIFDEATKKSMKNAINGLNQTISNFGETSKTIDAILLNNKSKIDATLSNVETASGSLATISRDLETVNVSKTVKDLQETLNKFNSVLASVENGEGSLGKLLKDEKMYNNLAGASKQMEELLEDMKLNPKRYVHFSLFGKKAKRYDAEGNEIKETKN